MTDDEIGKSWLSGPVKTEYVDGYFIPVPIEGSRCGACFEPMPPATEPFQATWLPRAFYHPKCVEWPELTFRRGALRFPEPKPETT